MKERSVTHSTFVIERIYPASPERVFQAFADPQKKRRWFVEGHGNAVDHYEMDFRVGGKELSRFRFRPGSPVAGLECINDGAFLNIVPNQRVVMASAMTIGGNCISAALATVELEPAGSGTNLILTHQGAFFEGSDGPERRQEGWRKLMEKLAEECERAD